MRSGKHTGVDLAVHWLHVNGCVHLSSGWVNFLQRVQRDTLLQEQCLHWRTRKSFCGSNVALSVLNIRCLVYLQGRSVCVWLLLLVSSHSHILLYSCLTTDPSFHFHFHFHFRFTLFTFVTPLALAKRGEVPVQAATFYIYLLYSSPPAYHNPYTVKRIEQPSQSVPRSQRQTMASTVDPAPYEQLPTIWPLRSFVQGDFAGVSKHSDDLYGNDLRGGL